MPHTQTSIRHLLSDEEEISYIVRWCKEVYLPTFTRDSGLRMFENSIQLRDWILRNIGARPTPNHHLVVTTNPYAPAEWVHVDRQMMKTIYRSYLQNK